MHTQHIQTSWRPTKELVRQWLVMRFTSRTPLPELSEIQRYLSGESMQPHAESFKTTLQGI